LLLLRFGKSIHVILLHWFKPVFALGIAFFNVHMDGLSAFVAIEKEAKTQQTKNGWHAKRFSPTKIA
jgi:hypothetical protein